MLTECFTKKVTEIDYDKELLITFMNELDEEKRSIRSFMRKYSNEPKEAGGGVGSERYRKLRRLKDRLGFLIEEREYVRLRIGDLKANRKLVNRAVKQKVEFCHAFLAAAESNLSEEQFLDLEAKAMNILCEQIG